MSHKDTLLIFDIDATLCTAGGLTREAYEKAAEKLYGVPDVTKGIIPHGLTDQLIFEMILDQIGLIPEDFKIEFDRFSELYLLEFGILIQNSNRHKLLNGVDILVNKLAQLQDVCLAIGTGNIESAAYMKLNRNGIADHFPVGGFGDNVRDRSEIIAIAFERAQNHYGRQFQKNNTWVIGDTPNDISAGKKLGVKTIAVGTGVFDQSELSEHNPTALFEDLSDWNRFLKVIS